MITGQSQARVPRPRDPLLQIVAVSLTRKKGQIPGWKLAFSPQCHRVNSDQIWRHRLDRKVFDDIGKQFCVGSGFTEAPD